MKTASKISLKVCGMREFQNIDDLISLAPDFIGFIFYSQSKRYVGENFKLIDSIPSAVKKVGVFVNEERRSVLEKVKLHQLDFVQLHGSESVDDCRFFKDQGVGVIKVFSVEDKLPDDRLPDYEPFVDYFLFDTRTPDYGGSGRKFDWEILKDYKGSIPFFLSGGIKVEDIEEIKGLNIPSLYAIDMNSGLELAPGMKDIAKVKKGVKALRGNTYKQEYK